MVVNAFRSKPLSAAYDFSYNGVRECPLQNRENKAIVCEMETMLLRYEYMVFFPYIILVAFEGGSIVRALILLLIYHVTWILSFECGMKVMIFITFCGLRLKDMNIVGRAVLPKFYFKNLNSMVYKVLKESEGGCKVVVFTSVPKVMVEGFMKEYLNVDCVRGTELHTFGQYYSGFVASSGVLRKMKAFRDFFEGKKQPDLGIGNGSDIQDSSWLCLCKEAYVLKKEDRTSADSLAAT